jgi:hypothetical protein
MKLSKRIFFAVILVLFAGLAYALVTVKQNPIKTTEAKDLFTDTSVLFIGNSYTSVNNLPDMIVKIATSKNISVRTDELIPGGYTWRKHLENKDTQAKIGKGVWDFVILQEQSQHMGFSDEQLSTQSFSWGKQLVKIINKQSPKSKAIFYQTWGHKNGDRQNCSNFPELCTYEGMQNRISNNYNKIAKETSSHVAPVGQVWQKMRKLYPNIELYSTDGSHPTPEGTYLATCVIFKTMFKKPVTGADTISIDPATAHIIQKHVDSIYK